MKKLIAVLMMLVAVPAMAQYRHHGHHGHHVQHHRHHYNWVTPMIVGGVVTYVLTRPQPVIQQPVIIQSTGQVCTEWKEIRHPDGTVVVERTCYQQ